MLVPVCQTVKSRNLALSVFKSQYLNKISKAGSDFDTFTYTRETCEGSSERCLIDV